MRTTVRGTSLSFSQAPAVISESRAIAGLEDRREGWVVPSVEEQGKEVMVRVAEQESGMVGAAWAAAK